MDNQLPEEWYSLSEARGNVSARGYLYISYRDLRGDTIELGIFVGTVKETSNKKSMLKALRSLKYLLI